MRKVIFLCGSPRKKTSISLHLAKILVGFLNYEYEFIELSQLNLSLSLEKKEPDFLQVLNKIQNADCVVWVSGVYAYFATAQMQLFMEKLFAHKFYFKNKISAVIMASGQVKDDYALEKIKFVIEQLGFGYIGETVIVTSMFGYRKEKKIEENCRLLAREINYALANNYVPVAESLTVESQYLFPSNSQQKIPVIKKQHILSKSQDIIGIIVSSNLKKNVFAKSFVAAFKAVTANRVEVLELRKHKINPCAGCRKCFLSANNVCWQKDEYYSFIKNFSKYVGLVFVSDCSCGIVDSYMKRFLDRSGDFGYKMTIKDKYSMAVMSGGGPLNDTAVKYLHNFINGATFCVSSLTDNNINEKNYVQTLIRKILLLDEAIKTKKQKTIMFEDKALHLIWRDIFFEWGNILDGYKAHYEKNEMFDYPKTKTISEIIKTLSKDPKLKIKLLKALKNTHKHGKNWQKKMLKRLIIDLNA